MGNYRLRTGEMTDAVYIQRPFQKFDNSTYVPTRFKKSLILIFQLTSLHNDFIHPSITCSLK